jgi:hypothetical protein
MGKKLLFIWIPKTGGTSIDRYFKLNHQVKNDDKFKYHFDNNSNVTFGHADINVLLKEHVMSLEFYKQSFKFCVVRNPYDRIVSLFFYQRLNKKYSFKEWVDYLYEHKECIPKNGYRNIIENKKINNQWNSMSSWIPDDIDKIYYFENINRIIPDINNQLNIKQNGGLTHQNKTVHKKYIEYYDKETCNKIYEIYKDDFTRFNYQAHL